MKNKIPNKIPAELLDRIISAAYGDASFFEKRRIYKLAAKNIHIKKILDEYTQTAKSVHSVPQKIYKGSLNFQKYNGRNRNLAEEIYLVLISKPAISVMAALLLVFAVSISVFSNKKITYNGYTFAEVQQARMESREALFIVNKIFNKTERQIRNDILINEISKPIKEGIESVNKLFKEKQNEL